MKKAKKYSVIDLESRFVYATVPTKKQAEKMKAEFETLDRIEGMFADCNYEVILEK